MAIFKKIFKDKKLKELIKEYDQLRADFNNKHDVNDFEKKAEDLSARFSAIRKEYSDSLSRLIRGYIFNINDFMIRNKKILVKQKMIKNEKDNSNTNNRATKTFYSNEQAYINNIRNHDE